MGMLICGTTRGWGTAGAGAGGGICSGGTGRTVPGCAGTAGAGCTDGGAPGGGTLCAKAAAAPSSGAAIQTRANELMTLPLHDGTASMPPL